MGAVFGVGLGSKLVAVEKGAARLESVVAARNERTLLGGVEVIARQ
jgi:hypothetical protein